MSHLCVIRRCLDGTCSDGDLINGWLGGGGFFTSQAALAFEFYKVAAGYVAPGGVLRAANITITGHSLGGGLAGLVAGIYTRPAVINNMPSGKALKNAYNLAPLGSVAGLGNVIHNADS